MPRPRFSNWTVQDTIVIPAGGSIDVLVDLVDTFYPQVAYQASWNATASTSGLAIKAYRGYFFHGTLKYTSSGDTISVTTQPTTSQGTIQTVINDFAINPELYPRFIKLTVQNLDATNACTIIFVGDR